MKRIVIFLSSFFILSFFTSSTFAHAGSHESQNCFITIANNTARFSGYQFQGLHPDQAYCRVLPDLGSVVIKIEPVTSGLMNKKVSLQLLQLHSWLDLVFNLDKALLGLKKTPLQEFNNGVVMLQTDIQQRGVYALAIELQLNTKKTRSEKFFFLVGIPVTEILVLFSGAVLLLLLFIAGKTGYKHRLSAK
jgi:hypothetical protein